MVQLGKAKNKNLTAVSSGKVACVFLYLLPGPSVGAFHSTLDTTPLLLGPQPLGLIWLETAHSKEITAKWLMTSD